MNIQGNLLYIHYEKYLNSTFSLFILLMSLLSSLLGIRGFQIMLNRRIIVTRSMMVHIKGLSFIRLWMICSIWLSIIYEVLIFVDLLILMRYQLVRFFCLLEVEIVVRSKNPCRLYLRLLVPIFKLLCLILWKSTILVRQLI